MTKQIPVYEYIAQIIAMSGKTQVEIAQEVGFKKPNMLSMIKMGKTKLPLTKAPALADALGIDRKHLVMRCLREYHPDIVEVLEESGMHTVSDNEWEIVNAIREVSNDTDPGMNEDRHEALKAAFGS